VFWDLYGMDSICHHDGVEPALLPIALIAGIGLASGVLTSLAGAGGATLSTAGVRAAGTTPSMAIGSTLPAVLPSAVVGSIRYARAGLVDWRVALTTGGAGAVLAIAGAAASGLVDARLLMIVCSVILGFSGAGLLRTYRRQPDAAATPATGSVVEAAPAVVKVALVGVVGGFVAGLLGLGGGIIVVPAFTRVLRMPLRTAIGSSLVAVAVLSVPAVIAHSLFGQVDWWVAIALIAGAIPGARLGSRLSLVVSEATIAMICGGVLVVLAGIQAATELSSLLG
jgi:uncharacterized membrane protein YfcA